MSQVFTCQCGRKTTEPFLIGNTKMCVICAEWESPETVTERERMNWHKYRNEDFRPHHVKERYGIR